MSNPTEVSNPTVGRMVHFHEDNGPYPAIVTAVNPDGTLELVTFGRNSIYFQHNVSGAPNPGNPSTFKGHWTWPPRQ